MTTPVGLRLREAQANSLRTGTPPWLVKMSEALKFYDDSQARDDHGRWTSDGGSGSESEGGEGEDRSKGWPTNTLTQSDPAAALLTKQKVEADQRNWKAQNARDQLNRDFQTQGQIAEHIRTAHGLDPAHQDPNLQLAHARLHSPAYDAIAPPDHNHGIAASELMAAFGDSPGHPFRGNQHTGGLGSGAVSGGAGTIKNYLQMVSTMQEKNGYHGPSTARFVLEHGEAFKPGPGTDPNLEVHPGVPQACYMNATTLVRDNPSLRYAEGYVIDKEIPIPIEHAWALREDGSVLDNTLTGPSFTEDGKDKAPRDLAYFGVAFPREDVIRWALTTKSYSIFANSPENVRAVVMNGGIPSVGANTGGMGPKGQALLATAPKMAEASDFGDVVGHGFHGNQYVVGSGGGTMVTTSPTIRPAILSGIKARAEAFYQAGGSVVHLQASNPDDQAQYKALAAQAQDKFVAVRGLDLPRDQVRGPEFTAGVFDDLGGRLVPSSNDHVLVALSPRGDPVGAMSYSDRGEGVSHVQVIGSTQEMKGAGTALEVELARRSPGGVDANYTTYSATFHLAMGREMAPSWVAEEGGQSHWSAAAVAQIAALSLDKVGRLAAAELVFTAHDSDALAETFEKLRADGKLKFGDVEGHDFHGNQWVAGSGGAAADMNQAAWSKAMDQYNSPMTEPESKDAFYAYDAEKEAGAHFANRGKDFASEAEANAYAEELVAKYAPGAKVTFGSDPSALTGAAGLTTPDLQQPSTYRIDIGEGWRMQSVIIHEVAHVVGTEKSGFLGHGASFRLAFVTMLKGEMPGLAKKMQAAYGQEPMPETMAEARIERFASITVNGKTVQCFAPAKVAKMGDVPGHDFHGNQYTGGIGGGGTTPHDLNPKILVPPAVLTAAMKAMNPKQRERYKGLQAKLDKAMASGEETKTKYTDPATGKYTEERQAQQQQLIENFKTRVGWDNIPNDRLAIIMGGLGGSGKSSLLRAGTDGTAYRDDTIARLDGSQATAKEMFGVDTTGEGATREEGARITNYLADNSDTVKEMMIGMGMAPQIEGLNPMETAALMHEESSDIAKQIANDAIGQGKNFIYDVTLGSISSGASKISSLHDAGYRVKLAYVSTTPETAIAQATFRWASGDRAFDEGKGQGGRFVSPRLQMAAFEGRGQYRSANEAAFYALIGSPNAHYKPDSYVIIDNENRARKVVAEG